MTKLLHLLTTEMHWFSHTKHLHTWWVTRHMWAMWELRISQYVVLLLQKTLVSLVRKDPGWRSLNSPLFLRKFEFFPPLYLSCCYTNCHYKAATHNPIHKHYIIVSTQWFKSGFRASKHLTHISFSHRNTGTSSFLLLYCLHVRVQCV